jgi:hypothetical protein
LTKTGLKALEFPEAPEMIKSSINQQKKAKYAINGNTKSKVLLQVGNNPSDFCTPVDFTVLF